MVQNTTNQPIDQQALDLTHAIALSESGTDGKPNYNAKGASGEHGAYQWMPGNFEADAKQAGLDPTDMSPENQDKVAYSVIKSYKDKGYDPGQIASLWNSGSPNNWQNHSGTNKEGAKYDTPAYVQKVKSNYTKLSGGTNNNPSPDTSTSATSATPQTFEEYLKQNPTGSQPGTVNPNLQAGNPTTPGNTTIGNAVANLTPGTKLAQGAGYGLASALGSQNGLIKANNRGIDIEGQLVQQIKDDKAKGKDTTKLETALKQLIPNLQERANEVSDIGTGGIKTSDVVKSAAGLATLPAAGYLSTALGGGGVLGTTKGLVNGFGGEGFLGSSEVLSKGALAAQKALADPLIKSLIDSGTTEGETVTRQKVLDILSNSLKDMDVSASGGPEEQTILKTIKALNPTLEEKKSLSSKVLKLLVGVGKTAVSGTILGGAINKGEKLAGLLK